MVYIWGIELDMKILKTIYSNVNRIITNTIQKRNSSIRKELVSDV